MRDDDAFAALVLRHLDGATSPEEDARLNSDLAASDDRRGLFVELCRRHGRLVEALASERLGRGATRPKVRWMALAAAAALAAAGLVYVGLPRPVLAARLEGAEGSVFRIAGPERVAVRAGDAVAPGDGLETGATSRATLRFDDGTRVEVGAGTRLGSLRSEGGKTVFVAQGTVAAEVVRQSVPMVVRTPEGEAQVLGTRLRLTVRPGRTRLEVEKGLVRLTRLSDRKSADVAAGQFAVASAETEPVARAIPSVRPATMAPGTWLSLPGTRMREVCPKEGEFPGTWGVGGPANVVAAWSGGALDTRRNRLVLWGGGHSDYHGNELYAFDLEALAWERVTQPTPNPSLGRQVNAADGTPNGRATYGGLAYLPHVDRLFASGGVLAGFGNADLTWAFDFASRRWTDRTPAGGTAGGGFGCIASCDPATGKVWWGSAAGSFAGLWSYDWDANAWTKHTADHFDRQTSAIDTKRGRLVFVGNGEVFSYDLRARPPVREAWTTTGGDRFVGRDSPGLDYDPVGDRIVGWSGGAVFSLHPETRAWTAHDAPGAPAATPNGIFGRWRYVPSLGVFVVVTSVDENVHVYKPLR